VTNMFIKIYIDVLIALHLNHRIARIPGGCVA